MKPLRSRSRPWWGLLALPIVAASLTSAAPARAQEEEKISLSYLLDWYYQYNLNHPPVGTNAGGRSFDVKNDAFSLSLAQINIVRAATEKVPVGFTATLIFGKTADLLHATEPGGVETYKHIQQLYGTYSTHGTTIDFGKFNTHHGYEVIESSSNDNYSRSLLFTYAVPLYHAGIRVSRSLTPTLTGGLHFVNGWNNVEDDNGGKSIGAQLMWMPNSAWMWAFNYMGGDESMGAALPANLNVQLLDVVGTWKPTPKLKLGVNVDYASASKPGTGGGNWSGWAFYGRYQLNPKSAFALRYELFQDSNGLRTGTAQNLNSLTATFEYAVGSNLLHRLEYRRDGAGKPFFPSAGTDFSGTTPVGLNTHQDTITFSQVIKF